MGKITFDLRGKTWSVEAEDIEIKKVMLSFMDLNSLSDISVATEQSAQSPSKSTVIEKREYKKEIPSAIKIMSFIKTLPEYRFNKTILEEHFIPDTERREKMKNALMKEYHGRWNANITYATRVIAKKEKGTWKVIDKEGNMPTKIFQK